MRSIISSVPVAHLNGRGDFEQVLEILRQYLRRSPAKRTLVGTVNDVCALAALRAFDEAGASKKVAVVGQNAILDARNELRRPNTRLIGTVAYFPERYGDEITPRNVDLIYPLDERRDVKIGFQLKHASKPTPIHARAR